MKRDTVDTAMETPLLGGASHKIVTIHSFNFSQFRGVKPILFPFRPKGRDEERLLRNPYY